MGILEDAKDTARATADRIGEGVKDGVERVKDKADEVRAAAEVKRAQAEQESVRMRNEAKERMRD